jgi:tetratricopeptide (TPR) repeat protein
LDESALRQRDAEGDAVAARELGVLLQEQHDLDEAEAAFGRAGERGDVVALGKLAILIDVYRDDPLRAEAAFRRADEAGSVDGAGNIGRILRDRGDLREAEEAFKRCVERGSVRALGDYAGLLSQREGAPAEEIAEAVRMLCWAEDRITTAGPELSDAAMEAGPAAMAFTGMWERCDPVAMETGVRAADKEGSASAAYHLGLTLRERSDLPAAASAFQRGGERGYATSWVNAAVCWSDMGKGGEAKDAAEQGEALGEAAGATMLGLIHEQAGDEDACLAAYRRADAGGDGNGSHNLGIKLFQRNELEEAEAAFARAEERGVANAAAARAQVRARLGL